MEIAVVVQGQSIRFNLDRATHRWSLVDATANDLLEEGEFPLITHAGGKRYELYSDGTFAEVEL